MKLDKRSRSKALKTLECMSEKLSPARAWVRCMFYEQFHEHTGNKAAYKTAYCVLGAAEACHNNVPRPTGMRNALPAYLVELLYEGLPDTVKRQAVRSLGKGEKLTVIQKRSVVMEYNDDENRDKRQILRLIERCKKIAAT